MSDDATAPYGVDRRQFLRTAVAAAVAGIVAQSGLRLASAHTLQPAAKLTPDAALEKLLAGNRRFVANQPTSGNRDTKSLREHTTEKQQPFAAVLSCSDSRVPVELVFDQSIGDVFVARVAGNVVTPEIIGSLEYGVAVLGVSALMVLGHTNCGAVKAAMKGETVPGQISALYAHLRPAVVLSGGSLAKAIDANAKEQAELLRTSSTIIQQASKAGTLKVVSAIYDLGTGKVAVS